jgi:signal peptidase I
MAPAFNTGALLVDLPVTPTTALHVGDVVTFHPTPGYTATHRIAALGAGGITTKGDANPSRDAGSLQPGMVVGRVALAIPYAGYAVVFFQQPLDVAALLLLLLGLLVVWHLTAASPTPRPSDARMGQEPS